MSSFALKSTKFALDILTRFIKADVRMHNADVVRDDMAIIFVVNHFTRLETLLLPYEIYRNTGLEPWSLAANELFLGRIGKFLRSVGSISTRDPHRDKIIIRSLLNGEHPWIIFPEGAMIKDKKLINEAGEFRVFSKGTRRAPHTGAAVLALLAEFHREQMRCLTEHNGGGEALDKVLDRFDLESYEEAAGRHTVIIPINITYFPIRSRKNLLLRFAEGIAKNLSDRARDEITFEGTILVEDSDVDITLGEPIDIRQYLERPAIKPLLECVDGELEAQEEDPRSVFNEAAHDLMHRYMGDIYRLTTLNYDHIFATIIRHQSAKTFTERAYRNRIYLSVRRILELGKHNIHGSLRKRYRDILYEDPSPKFDDFMSLCLKEKIIVKEGPKFVRNFEIKRGKTEFHSIRGQEITYVIANEIEPLTEVIDIIKEVATLPRNAISKTIGEINLKEDQDLFESDYDEFFQEEHTKPPSIGRPFLLTPARLKGGIVLVHGYMAAPLEVRAMADYLCGRGYAVYGVRLKGHGTSPQDLARTRWEDWYESVNRGYAVIKSMTDDIVMGGFSTGGALALLAAGKKKDKLRAVFSINAPLRLRNYAVHLVSPILALNALLGKIIPQRKEGGRWEYLENDPENEQINYSSNPTSGVKQLGEAMDEFEKWLKLICVPTLIIQGSRDPVVDPASGQLIFGQVGTTKKELTIIERDRHGIINGEGSEDIFHRVEQFLYRSRKTWGEAGG